MHNTHTLQASLHDLTALSLFLSLSNEKRILNASTISNMSRLISMGRQDPAQIKPWHTVWEFSLTIYFNQRHIISVIVNVFNINFLTCRPRGWADEKIHQPSIVFTGQNNVYNHFSTFHWDNKVLCWMQSQSKIWIKIILIYWRLTVNQFKPEYNSGSLVLKILLKYLLLNVLMDQT